VLQQRLEGLNAQWMAKYIGAREFQQMADGDVELVGVNFEEFVSPVCDRCSGILKPGGGICALGWLEVS
jgi:hypothetical protein